MSVFTARKYVHVRIPTVRIHFEREKKELRYTEISDVFRVIRVWQIN